MAQFLTLPDLVGYAGSVILVVIYFMNLNGRIDTRGLRYPLSNLCACLLIMVSLIYSFNPASFVIEIFWSLVSLYGVISYCIRRASQTRP